ncbi:MAG: nickel-dependent lactate racemase [Rhodospirillales bacterium]|nr:nickel-dependent lactate racemase [Rhodospirillales bacterium]
MLDHIDIAIQGQEDVPLPRMIPVEQKFPRDSIVDPAEAVRETLDQLPKPDVAGKRIAITAGSRGIPHLIDIMTAMIARLKEWGADPFIVPAMGSHGGATAEGQLEVLAGYGITEQSMGVPILSSMEVAETASVEGVPLYCDRYALEADGIVVVNKIKPHSNYKGDYESGLCKMMVIGLGKHKGAAMFHSLGFGRFADIVPKAAAAQIEKLPFVFALGLVENAYDGLAVIEAMPADRMIAREKELLALSKDIMGKFLMSSIDVLIVDEVGKNISGQGMDPTVTGRPSSGLPGFVAPPIKRIIIRDVSEASHGNAAGIGVGDLITLRLFNKLDLGAMYTNGITARNLEGARIPVVVNSDRQAIEVALFACLGVDPAKARIVRIKNTKKMQKIWMSEPYLDEIEAGDSFEPLGPPEHMTFDGDGNLAG